MSNQFKTNTKYTFHDEEFVFQTKKNYDLIVLPVYRSNVADPCIEYVKNYCFPEKKSIISESRIPGDTFVEPFNKGLIMLYYLSDAKTINMSAILTDVVTEMMGYNPKRIAINVFGIVEYGFKEALNTTIQEKFWEDFAKKNPQIEYIDLYSPDSDHRPATGKHLTDEPNLKSEITDEVDHHTITIDENKVDSYLDYLVKYSLEREQSDKCIGSRKLEEELAALNIKETHNTKTYKNAKRALERDLGVYFNGSPDIPYRLSRFKGQQKSKYGGFYMPKPSLKVLKVIILMFAMNYDEAMACLNFFGYGLARFDPEDKAFITILKKWDRSDENYDVRRINKYLKHRFGKEAALF